MNNHGEPLAIWDTRDRSWWPVCREATKWAMRHINRASDTYRAEFYLIDAPFAIVYRYARNADGRVRWDRDAEDFLSEEPVRQMLDELPPARLLTKAGPS